MTDTVNFTTAIILSGGAGSRLNGVDKGLQRYQGSTLIEHVIARVSPQVSSIVVCANRNIERYAAMGVAICQDQERNYQGPMSGISSALNKHLIRSSATQALVSSCDVPGLPLDLKERLQLSLDSMAEAKIAVAHDGKRRQNLHCLIKRDVWRSLIDYFDSGGRAVHRWCQQHASIDVDFSDSPESFININTEQQLQNLRDA